MPLRIIAAFWTVTLFLFFADPFEVYGGAPNQMLLLSYMLLNIILLVVVSYVRFGTLPPVMASEPRAVRFFRASFAVSLLMLPLNIHFYTGSTLSEFFTLLTDPTMAYARMQMTVSADRMERIEFLVIKLVFSWLTIALVPLAIILHKSRLITTPTMLSALCISFVLSVFRGTDKEIGDILVFIIAGLFLVPIPPAAGTVGARTKTHFRLLSRQGLLFLFGSGVFLYFFAFRKSERLANLSAHCFANTNICMDYASPEISPLRFLFSLLYRYATHGYYGLAASFDAAWNMCPLVGHSRVLSYLSGLVGSRCENMVTDQLDVLGWTSRGAWSTGFTQLANDFGHVGTYGYVIFFAVALKIFYTTHIVSRCYLSAVMYMLNFFILFYMVGNLQMQQVGEQYFGYIFLNLFVLARLLTRRTAT